MRVFFIWTEYFNYPELIRPVSRSLSKLLPDIRDYALNSYSLLRKWVKEVPILYKTLEALELESILIRPVQDTWTLTSNVRQH